MCIVNRDLDIYLFSITLYEKIHNKNIICLNEFSLLAWCPRIWIITHGIHSSSHNVNSFIKGDFLACCILHEIMKPGNFR